MGWCVAAAMALVLRAGVPEVWASPPAALLNELAAAERAQRDPGLTVEQRAQAADRAFAARARVIEAAGDDDNLPTWLIDQAAAMLDRLALDGADASSLFGVPTARQRERVQAEAWGAFQLVTRADQSIGRLAKALQEGALETGGKSVEQVREQAARVEAALTRLVDTEQAVRVPYYRGRAACLLASLETGEAAKTSREDNARVAIESLAKLPLANPGAEAIRRVTLGAAMLMLFPREDKPRNDARQLFQGVAAQSPAEGVAPGTIAQAWMGLVRCARGEAAIRAAVDELSRATRREPFVAAGAGGAARTDPLLNLLAAEGVARAMLAELPRDSTARTAWVSDALMPMVALLSREDLRADREALAPVVSAKVGAACEQIGGTGSGGGGGVAWDKLDPRIGFARAVALVQRGGAGIGAGVTLLESLAEREDAGDLRASALWELAVLRSKSPLPADAVAAIRTLAKLAREFPGSPQAPEAALKAMELARYNLAAAGRDPARAAEIQPLADLYGQSLELAYRLRPADPETGARRIERARLILDSAGRPGSRDLLPAQLDAALDALDGVPSDAGGGAGAAGGRGLRKQADDLAASAVQDAVSSAQRAAQAAAPGGEPAAAARERLIAATRRAVQWAQSSRPALADAYRLILAESLVEAKDARALAVFEELASRKSAGAGQDSADVRTRIRLGLGRAQRVAGRPGDGFATLRALVEEVDQQLRDAPSTGPTAPARPAAYWSAWAEMLEILSADNANGQRSETIRLQIRRLRILSPDLGGEATRQRIEAVARGV